MLQFTVTKQGLHKDFPQTTQIYSVFMLLGQQPKNLVVVAFLSVCN